MRIHQIFIVCFMLSLAACKPDVREKETPEDTLHVKAEPAVRVTYKVPVRLMGILGTKQEMKLSFKTGGIIGRVNVRDGENVKKGHELISLNLEEIEAHAKQASVAYKKAKRDLERTKNLYADSVATLEQYQNSQSAYEMVKAQKQIADFNLLHSKITAPSNGKVQKVLAEANEIIAPGYPAILFASTESDWVVRVAVTDKDVVKLRIGDSAIVTMDAFPGDTLSATISELGSIADPVTGTYEAELHIRHPDPRFRTGYISRVLIYPHEKVTGISVPMNALLDISDHNAYAYVVKEGKAIKRNVKTGNVKNGHVIILEGISAGDSVIVSGAHYIQNDTRIRITN
ncbi:MAG: efflux RND transporter periplasmic adaptor subunit [Bacteroidales bacterium]|nr:efflux RND transporter periplasmic adaptor subunit [Bacteroidales bacterium]